MELERRREPFRAREVPVGSIDAEGGIEISGSENIEVNNEDTGTSGSSRKPDTAIRAKASSLRPIRDFNIGIKNQTYVNRTKRVKRAKSSQA